MPVVQEDLVFSYAGAGALFMALAVGNGTGLLLSGFVSRAFTHRRTVGLSAIAVGTMALLAPLATDYAMLAGAMFGMGVAAGLYLPSGMAVITSLVQSKDWGKALAVHELAPNISFVVAPLVAEAVLAMSGWRTALYLLGGVQVLLGLLFLAKGRGGDFPGIVPNPSTVAAIVKRPVFWLLILLFSMAVGASIGLYSMLPLYLADSHGFTRESANELLSTSRIMACFVPFLAGWITDRWGARPAIFLFCTLTGASLIVLSMASGPFLVIVALVQPMFTVLLFPPGFTMLSMLFPPDQRSVAIALAGPFNALIGMGVVPIFLGFMGDMGRFDLGFMVLGMVVLGSVLLLPLLPAGRAGES